MLALGHPWGEPYSVTLGVFSGWVTVRTGGPRGTLCLLRTDAALAPGNSGGPLLDAWGRVVGVSAMVVGGDQSLAVPADAVDGLIREGNG
jgi:serine protease Do